MKFLVVGVCLVFAHFIADFLCQTDDMARRKSKEFEWLMLHVVVYTLVLIVLGAAVGGVKFGVFLGNLNGVLHLAIDFCTSKATSRLWQKQSWHWFFCVIGFDQALHTSILLASAYWLLGCHLK